jgi:UDP:flavonoid glycosyltransferase YjiC (YdhE family)
MTSRILFTSWPFEGHVLPLLSIARAAAARGDAVAFSTGRRWDATLAEQGVRSFPFARTEGVWERVHERERSFRGRTPPVRLQRAAFREWLVESIPAQVEDLQQVVKRWHPDVIVTDGAMWGPSLVLRELVGLPVVYFSTLIYAPIPGPDAPVPGSRLGTPFTTGERALAKGLARLVDILGRDTRRRLDAVRGAYGLRPLGEPVNNYMARLPLYLVGSLPELDLNRWDLPPTVRYVGALVWHPPDTTATAEWLATVPAADPWVHVTEGTSHHGDPFLLRAAASGLAGLPLQAILTTGRDRDPSDLGLMRAANVHVAPWLSHSTLLPRTRALVTTGGAQTIMAALQAGVPLVVVPTGWDKPANASRLERAGVAVTVAPRRCTPERLRGAVQQVLDDPGFRQRAAALAARLAAAPGPAGAAELIGALAPSSTPTAAPALQGG